MTTLQNLINSITDKLTNAFTPSAINIEDKSQIHANHPEAKLSGGCHLNLYIVSSEFTNKSRIERHRMIYNILGGMVGKEIHALAINAKSPDEV